MKVIANLAFLVCVATLSACSESPEQKERSHSRDVIATCWKEQSKKSIAPSEARFVAGVCERLEDKYREKYGRNP